MTIKNKLTGEVMCEGRTLAEVLSDHAKWAQGPGGKRANLRGADLRDANLRRALLVGADLGGAQLAGADLRDAYLRGVDMRSADLRGANLDRADLSGANLSGANLNFAELGRAADLRGADLRGANLNCLGGVPKIANIHAAVFAAAAAPCALDMRDWHSCETTHCRAGWVVTLAGEAGAMLEREIGTPAAAALIYMASDPKLERIPDFFASDDEALADMRRLAEAEGK